MARPSAARKALLARYREVRASIQRVLSAAQKGCAKADMLRGSKLLDLDWNEQSDWPVGVFQMAADLALFEPNQRGVRPYDRFLAKSGQGLAAPDLALAERMAQARYSLFTCAGRHEVGGVWLADRLRDDERIWLMDESFERFADELDGPFGMRVFGAGEFHAGFGIVAPTDEETLSYCLGAMRRGVATPFRHSIAATTYADHVLRLSLPPAEFIEVEELFDLLESFAAPAEAEPPRNPRRKKRSAP